MVPPNGVWVRASYPGSYIGLIGTPGNQLEVSGTGDKFYPISTSDGIVAAALQKKDGSGDKILLEVYKNGVMLKRESTVTPRGIVEVQLDLKTLPGTCKFHSLKNYNIILQFPCPKKVCSPKGWHLCKETNGSH